MKNKKEIMEIATNLSTEASNARILLSQRFFVDETTEEIQQTESEFYRKLQQIEIIRMQLATAVLQYVPEKDTDE